MVEVRLDPPARAEHDTAFTQHLRIHVRTGIDCRYDTDPTNPIEWNISAGRGNPP